MRSVNDMDLMSKGHRRRCGVLKAFKVQLGGESSMILSSRNGPCLLLCSLCLCRAAGMTLGGRRLDDGPDMVGGNQLSWGSWQYRDSGM